jgi:hypothetical protein
MPTLKGGHALGPDDALLVMAGLDDRADQTRHADAVGAHVDGDAPAGSGVATVAPIGSEYLVPK